MEAKNGQIEDKEKKLSTEMSNNINNNNKNDDNVAAGNLLKGESYHRSASSTLWSSSRDARATKILSRKMGSW